MVDLPLWAAFALGFGSPLLAFLGVLVAQLMARRSAGELETRSRREETMRNLRWAAELSAREDGRMAELGVAELEALLGSDLLDDKEKVFVETALSTVYEAQEEELDQLGSDAVAVQELRRAESGGRAAGDRVSSDAPRDQEAE